MIDSFILIDLFQKNFYRMGKRELILLIFKEDGFFIKLLSFRSRKFYYFFINFFMNPLFMFKKLFV